MQGNSLRIILKCKEGSVAIMTLAEGADVDETVRKFKESHPDTYGDWMEFKGKLPSSREFRDAWTHNGKGIVVDAAKASAIHLGRIRHARNAALEKLDKEHLRHLGNPDKVKEIEERKQSLRDLPSKVKDLEWPEGLN